jgi:diaminopimelate epimerase
MDFTKMHGLGNDFVVIENLDGSIGDLRERAAFICDRHTGVGADGILVVEKSDISDIKMIIINSDGSEAEMCGNGIRCFAKYVFERGIIKTKKMNIETLAGNMIAELEVDKNNIMLIKINMGRPSFEKEIIPFRSEMDNLDYNINIKNKVYRASTILMGVPHTIIYVDELIEEEVIEVGKIIEKLNLYPLKTNVNFVKVIDKGTIKIRTWERGAGITLACGTGTCASVVACLKNKLTENKVTALLPVGRLNIEYKDGYVYMEGPAEYVFTGIL